MLLISQLNHNENSIIEIKELIKFYYRIVNVFLNESIINFYKINVIVSKIESLEEELKELEFKNKNITFQLFN